MSCPDALLKYLTLRLRSKSIGAFRSLVYHLKRGKRGGVNEINGGNPIGLDSICPLTTLSKWIWGKNPLHRLLQQNRRSTQMRQWKRLLKRTNIGSHGTSSTSFEGHPVLQRFCSISVLISINLPPTFPWFGNHLKVPSQVGQSHGRWNVSGPRTCTT